MRTDAASHGSTHTHREAMMFYSFHPEAMVAEVGAGPLRDPLGFRPYDADERPVVTPSVLRRLRARLRLARRNKARSAAAPGAIASPA